MKKIFDKVVVITGASSGIGYQVAKNLASKGAKVYNISRRPMEDEIFQKSFACDVNETEKVDMALNEIYNKEGKIDVFMNNAGFGIAGAIENAKAESIYSLVNTNLSAVIALSGVAVKYLKMSGGGNIINTCSVGGIIPLPYQATYSATKAGVDVFSRALANEVKQFKIKVTTILPGDMKTGFTKARIIENDAKDDSYKKSVEKSIKKAEKEEINGQNPEIVGKVVYKILKKKNPPLRKTIGFSYKLIVFLPRIFPIKFVNWLVRKIYI